MYLIMVVFRASPRESGMWMFEGVVVEVSVGLNERRFGSGRSTDQRWKSCASHSYT